MIEVVYRREVPYSQAVVLSQYFDLEHLEHVHPRSFGRALMVSKSGNTIVWDLKWPPILWLLRFRSRFVQEYNPPWGISAVITGVGGRHACHRTPPGCIAGVALAARYGPARLGATTGPHLGGGLGG